MGVRGTLPTPTKIRILNGNPSRRPLLLNEPQFAPGIPDRPTGMSAGARKHWDELVGEMANSGVLRRVGPGCARDALRGFGDARYPTLGSGCAGS